MLGGARVRRGVRFGPVRSVALYSLFLLVGVDATFRSLRELRERRISPPED